MKHSARAIAWVALGLVLTATAAHSQCPVNQGLIGVLQNCASPESTDPIFSMSGSECLNGSGSVSYDLIAGTIDVTSYSYSHESFETWLRTQDDFVIVGPASAIPIAAIFTGSLHRSEVRLSSGAVMVSMSADGSPTQSLRLDLRKLPGEHFLLGIFASGSGIPDQGTSRARGNLGFTALPPGYSLVSCQGYAALPVATRATRWWRLKQLYR